MYVCLCRGITEKHIHDAVADGACNMRDLCQCLGVATQCGRCGKCAREVLQQALATRPLSLRETSQFLPMAI